MSLALNILSYFAKISRKKNKKPSVNNVFRHSFAKPFPNLNKPSSKNATVSQFKTKPQIFREKISRKYMDKDYEQNAFNHFTFLIDGQYHTYSIVELDMIGMFECIKELKSVKADF